MSTRIEWVRNPDGTPGETWNPLRGTKGAWHCTKVSPECAYCYAERINMDNRHNGPAYKVGADTMRLDEKVLRKPLTWRKPRTCFICSMTDAWHEDVPFEWMDRILEICRHCPKTFFLLLTKRAERALEFSRRYGPASDLGRWPANLGCGVSVGMQRYLRPRVDALLQMMDIPFRFLSLEPLLEYLNLSPYLDRCSSECNHGDVFPAGHKPEPSGIGAIVVGGETGPKARPMNIDNVRTVRDLCISAGVPFTFKQWGEWTCDKPREFWGKSQWVGQTTCPRQAYLVGRAKSGHLLDGREWNEFPCRMPGGQRESSLHRQMGASPPDGDDRRTSGNTPADELQVSLGSGGRTEAQQQLF